MLLVIALGILLAPPGPAASDAEILRYYETPGFAIQGSLAFNLVVFAMIGFMWFVAVIRHRLGEYEPRFFSTLFFGGGILYAAMTLAGTASLAAPMVLKEVWGHTPDPAIASITRSFGVVILAGAVPRVQALVVFSTATLGRVTGTLPAWLVWVSYLLGLGLLVMVTFFTPGAFAFPAWVSLVSVVILVHPRHRDVEGT